MANAINASDVGRFMGGRSGSFAHLDRIGAPREALGAMLYPLVYKNGVWLFDDFVGDTLDTNLWAVATDVGATAFAVPAEGSTLAGGALTGATGTTDDEGLSIRGPAIFTGDKNAGMAVRSKVSAVTGVQIEIGFVDPLTDFTLPAVSDVDTPAIGNGAVTVAVFHLDTDQTLTTAALVMDGDTTYATTAETVSAVFTPTADTYFTVQIQLTGDTAELFVLNENNVQVGKAAKALAVEGGTLLMPFVYYRTRNTTSKTVTVDYIAAWADR